MTEKQLLKRKIQLKKQAIPLIKDEIISAQIRLTLLVLRDRLESRITKDFDSDLGRYLEAVTILLEEADVL